MIRSIQSLIVMASVLVAGAVSAQNLDVIKARQAIYKSFGEATKAPGQMLKGAAAFDLAAVTAALNTYAAGAAKLPALFPEDSKTGLDTAALPEIWANKADFEARAAKLAADSAAAARAVTDEASFKATMPKILGECGGCHKLYRQKS